MKAKRRTDASSDELRSAKRFKERLDALNQPASNDDGEEFARFRRLAHGLIRVPKDKIDRQR